MKTFQIITDSSCDLPQELADKLELLVLPLHFTIGGKTYANYLDGREIGFHDFFERIRQGEAASTSAVNPESFREVMEQTLQQGLDILFVGFSSGLSTTYQSGCIAADDLREKYPERKILTVDSLCASLGQGLYVYLGALQQQAGKSIEEVRDYLEDIKLHLCHWFTVDDLMYLKRGGRISATTAVLGTVMQIKLKQGFGRAIRTETDTCVVAILDERCSARGRYRQDVLDALPEMPILTEVSDIRQFLCAVKPQSYFEAAA